MIANRYELGRVLGSGGFATVYEAKDFAQERAVAVKVIHGVSSSADAPRVGDERDVVERFRLEALQLSQLRSPNVARVYDFGRDEEHGLYLVMELIDGAGLEPKQLGRVLLGHEVLRAARALLSGLAEAHAARIVHRDIKPANVLVPGGIAGLAGLKILDFGIAQSEHRAQLESASPVRPRALGTPAYMAPELLVGEPSTPASDVYAAGLVLYELLGHTLLFPERAAREQQHLRTEMDPVLAGRVPPPLDAMLARMLARRPDDRFPDAGAALAELVNMETAPVDVDEGAGGSRTREDVVPPSPPSRRRSLPPGYARPTLGTARLSRLDPDGTRALASTLHNLDLPMLDALARRERGSEASRVARALTLGLRLEIDAASLVIESDRGPAAHALAACVLAPRARVATRARIMRSVGDGSAWLDAVDAPLGELFVAMQAAICGPEEVPLALARAERLLAREGPRASSRITLELARDALAARSRGVTEASVRAFEELAASDATAPPLSSILRALLLGPLAFRIDDHVARASFERAAQLAAETGATLLEARALGSLGGMLIEVPGRLAQGISSLERVTTLLLHADAPSLEHLAAHNRGVAYIVEGRFAEAAEQLQHAREVASGEAPLELEILSGAQELSARLAAGDLDGARVLARLLEVSRNVASPRSAGADDLAPREAMLVRIACTLVKLVDDDLEGARADLARARSAGGGDALLLAGALAVIHAAGAGEPVDYLASAAELHRTAEEHGFAAFYWFDLLRAIVRQVPEPRRAAMAHAVDRLVVLLGSATKA